jgi:hypothetical protein
MQADIQRVSYFHATVRDRPGEAFKLLVQLAESGVNLLAVNAVPVGPEYTQLVIFPQREDLLVQAAQNAGIILTGPEHAFLCRGDDRLGAFAEVHRLLYDANVNVYASSGVTSGDGGFGYVLYVKADQFENAARVLGL